MTGLERASAAALALLLGAQGVGKLLDLRLYIVALDRFRAFPKSATATLAIVWVALELVALVGLVASAIKPMRAAVLVGAAAAALDALAYAALTIGTKLRGIDVLNCTCFGAFLPQRLSVSVLIQDLVMVAWTLWMLRSALRFTAGPTAM